MCECTFIRADKGDDYMISLSSNTNIELISINIQKFLKFSNYIKSKYLKNDFTIKPQELKSNLIISSKLHEEIFENCFSKSSWLNFIRFINEGHLLLKNLKKKNKIIINNEIEKKKNIYNNNFSTNEEKIMDNDLSVLSRHGHQTNRSLTSSDESEDLTDEIKVILYIYIYKIIVMKLK
eukprot:GHVL01000076.1.p1 GENE.GHVL01000076.1~~GHVL01000076.1.p1  ORF type:complete len:179 (+),score=59.78 GHVL01000076.1:77-613(+)